MANKRKENQRLYFIAFCLIAILLVVAPLAVVFISGSMWDKGRKINIVIDAKPLLLLSYDLNGKSLNALAIPADVSTDTVLGYGTYRLDKLYKLDQQERKNGRLFTATISKLFGIPVDAYIHADGWPEFSDEKLSKEDFVRLKNELNTFNKPFGSLRSVNQNTNHYTDVIKGMIINFEVKTNNISFINLSNSSVYNGDSANEAKTVDTEKLDEILKNYFNEQNITGENLNIEVLNATKTAGLAEKAARLVNNIGGIVINTGNFYKYVDQCEIYSGLVNKNSYTVLKLKEIFDCRLNVAALEGSRADISLVLGSRYREEFYKN